jgi:hypothetical protein
MVDQNLYGRTGANEKEKNKKKKGKKVRVEGGPSDRSNGIYKEIKCTQEKEPVQSYANPHRFQWSAL